MAETGVRLRSQVIVIKTGDALDDLRAGGNPMFPLGTQAATDLVTDPDFASGGAIGKRYVDKSAVEVPVMKAGRGRRASAMSR